jgi:hypothetical protein
VQPVPSFIVHQLDSKEFRPEALARNPADGSAFVDTLIPPDGGAEDQHLPHQTGAHQLTSRDPCVCSEAMWRTDLNDHSSLTG